MLMPLTIKRHVLPTWWGEMSLMCDTCLVSQLEMVSRLGVLHQKHAPVQFEVKVSSISRRRLFTAHLPTMKILPKADQGDVKEAVPHIIGAQLLPKALEMYPAELPGHHGGRSVALTGSASCS